MEHITKLIQIDEKYIESLYYEEITNVEDLKFYFIPSEEFTYFSDNRSLQNIIFNSTLRKINVIMNYIA